MSEATLATCPDCKGTGGEGVTCGTCGGSGSVKKVAEPDQGAPVTIGPRQNPGTFYG